MRTLRLYPTPPRAVVEVTEAEDLNSACVKCKLHAKARTVCLPADGEPGGVYILGDHPADADDKAGRPFSGAVGSFLRTSVDRHWKGPVIYDNALRCAPGAAKIQPNHYTACRGHLAAILKEAKPQRIVALGAGALHGLFGRAWQTFSTRKGYAWLYDTDVPVFFVIHPSGAMRNRFVRSWFEEDLHWALTAEPPPKPPLNGVAHIIETAEDSQDAFFKLVQSKSLTYDYETFGRVNDSEFKALCLGVGDVDSDDAYIWPEAALYDLKVAEPIRGLLESAKSKGGLHEKYDAQVHRAVYGTWPRGQAWDAQLWRKMLQADALGGLDAQQPLVGMGGGKDEIDTYLAEGSKEWVRIQQLLGIEDMPKRGKVVSSGVFDHIDPTTRALVADRIYNAQAHKANKNKDPHKAYSFAAIPKDMLYAYCARDIVSESRLYKLHEPQMRAATGRWAVWNKVALPLSRALTAMEYNGIKPSVPKIIELQRMCTKQIAEYEVELKKWGDFNPGSGPQVAALLYDQLKLPVHKETDTGRPSTDAEALSKLDHPLAKALVGWKKAKHFKGTYADGMLVAIRDDGRIHCSIKQTGTESSRPSSTDPNLFNLPRPKTEAGKLCRDVFIAEDGYELLEGDFSQIEIVIAAMLSNDQTMLEICHRPGADFHLETAKLIAPVMGIDPASVTKEHVLRDQAKTLNFSVLYGKSAAGVASTLGITKKHAEKLMAALFGQFKQLNAWIKAKLAETQRTGFASTWWDGQDAYVRPLWQVADADSDSRGTAERSSSNTPIQGTAATFTNASLGEIQRRIDTREDSRFNDTKLVLTVYDSIILEIPKGKAEYVGRGLLEIMTGWPANGAPIRAELKHGPALGSLSTLHL